MSPLAASIVSEATTSLQHIDVPPVLRERIDQHKENLIGLACALLAVGQDSNDVRQTIEEVLDGFKDELFRSIQSLMENTDAL